MLVKFKLNGLEVEVNAEPGESLLDTLKKYGIKSLKKGCDGSACGVCTVLVNNKPVLSCSYLTGRVEGKEVTTVEGIQEVASKIADCFGDQGADQCGYCNASLALTIHALSLENKNATEDEIRHYIVGNLCRCTGYQAQVKAIKQYLGGLK